MSATWRQAVGVVGLALVGAGTLVAPGAANDGVLEPDGIWHDEHAVFLDAPGRSESFTLELQTFRFDVTSVEVRLFDGATVTRVPMAWDREADNGTYDIWSATIPGVDSTFLYYRFEIRDGSAYGTLAHSGYWDGDPPGGDYLLNLTELGGYELGATVDGSWTVFRVWAPEVEDAEVILHPETPSPTYVAMTHVQGFWQVRVHGVGHGDTYQYRFFRDGAWLVRNDARAKRVAPDFAYSVVQQSDYPWTDDDWVPPELEDSIISEAHVGTFSGRGDGATNHPATYRDLADRHVAHIADSGINVLQLMPIQEFPGELSWGYNPSFLFAPESSYGTPDDLKYLVDACHRAGIAVWLDIVLNHVDGPNLPDSLGWYNGDDIYFYSPESGMRDTGYGPRPDYGRVEVRDYLVDSVRHLIEEYHIDGFRLDHTSLIKINREGWLLLKEITQMVDRHHPHVVVTAEQWPNDAALTRPVASGGAGLDAQWSDIFHDNSRAALNQLAYGDPSMGAIADGLNHFGYTQREMINFIESHDEARESPQFAYEGRIVQVADQINPHSDFGLGRGKLFWGLTMYGAATPLVLYGQEIATDIGFGDKERNKIPWEYKDLYPDYYRACREMAWLRRVSPALRSTSWQNVYHLNEGANVLAWERAEDGHYVIVVANFANNDWDSYWIGLPAGGTWYETINTSHTNYGGPGTHVNGTVTAFDGPSGRMPYSIELRLPRYGMVVLTKHAYDLNPRIDADRDGMDDAWERDEGLNPNDASDADANTDGDELTAFGEYLFGGSTAAPDQAPAVDLAWGPDGPRVEFPTLPEREYRVEYSHDASVWRLLGTPWSTRTSTVPGLASWEVQEPDTPSSFLFRVGARIDSL